MTDPIMADPPSPDQARPHPTADPASDQSAAYDVDVIHLSDFRLPGGTTSSIAEEVRVQSEVGLTTALVHAASSITNYPNAWSAHMQRILDLPRVHIASARSRVHARVLIIRHPTVIYSAKPTFEGISADTVVVVVNHAAIDAAGTQHYPVEDTDRRVRELFGKEPIWAPIGPVVRQTVLQQTRRVPLRDADWVNVFGMPDHLRERTGFIGDRPVIGRHSRPQPGKWPATAKDIRAAYPESAAFQVEILGGAQVAESKLKYVPERWNVIPFGGEDPYHFLSRIDFWVYMHHPDLKEAFGRAAMEAMAAGCVAIMPPYMKDLFGDAGLYATPGEVQKLVTSLYADPERFLEMSHRAQQFARGFRPHAHIERLEELGVHPPARNTIAQDDAAAHQGRGAACPRHVLVLSGDDVGPAGAGVLPEHLPESRDAAGAAYENVQLLRALQDRSDRLVHIRFSKDAPPHTESAVPTVVVATAHAMNATEADWQEYLSQRIARMGDVVEPTDVVVIGDCLSDGALRGMHQLTGRRSWIRPGASRAQDESSLAYQGQFSRVILAGGDRASDIADSVMGEGN